MPEAFSYDEFASRNIGFVTEDEQARLRQARVIVIGTGGMGGAALQSLARTGIGAFDIADFDTFEVSNLNRQVFADLDSVGLQKAEATKQRILRINPEAEVVVHSDWLGAIDDLFATSTIVINGTDDIAAGIELYRRAARQGATVVDAYTSPLPSVIVVGPNDERPEARLRYPSIGRAAEDLDADALAECLLRELQYVLVHSSSADHIVMDAAVELLQGKRKRMSFAPMVITTGNLMAFEVVKHVLGKTPTADSRGYFLNPWTMRVERPRHPVVAAARAALVRRFLARMVGDA